MEKAIEKSRKKLAEVKTALAAFDWKNNISIYGGKCGYLIFLNELMKYEKPGSQYETQIETLCEDIFNDVQSHDFNATFGNGMAGVVYTLSRIGLTEAIDREILEWIEQQAVKTSGQDIYDFIYGSAGMVYALSEAGYDNPEFFQSWLDQIEQKLVPAQEGFRLPLCFINQAYSQNDYQFNYSLSHGMMALVVVITGLLEKKQVSKKHETLVTKIIDSFLRLRNPQVNHEAGFYPSIVLMDNTAQYFKRMSWCYGDLGVAIALNRYIKYSDNVIYRDCITEILDHYTQYTRAGELDVKDADFCHGAAGIAIIYLTFYHETGNETYRQTARRWLNIMLEMDTHSDGAAGYIHFDPSGSYSDYGLLEGLSGIGLTLLGFLSAEKQDWQKCFLMH